MSSQLQALQFQLGGTEQSPRCQDKAVIHCIFFNKAPAYPSYPPKRKCIELQASNHPVHSIDDHKLILTMIMNQWKMCKIPLQQKRSGLYSIVFYKVIRVLFL